MLVQVRDNALRLIRQHDHALLCGQMAARWCGTDNAPGGLAFELILATALHDSAWIDEDRTPRFNPETGTPHDFISLPIERRLMFYTSGLDAVARIHPHAGILCSMHYTTFVGMDQLQDYQGNEQTRRDELVASLDLGNNARDRLSEQLLYLKFFDNLSLHLCLTPPGSTPEAHPVWLAQEVINQTPREEALTFRWVDENRLAVAPFPFEGPIETTVPYRDLPERRFDGPEALGAAWSAAKTESWPITIAPN